MYRLVLQLETRGAAVVLFLLILSTTLFSLYTTDAYAEPDDTPLYEYLNRRAVESMNAPEASSPAASPGIQGPKEESTKQYWSCCQNSCLVAAPALTHPGAIVTILLLIAGLTWAIHRKKKINRPQRANMKP
jgi:hypothetical protein